MSIKVALKSFKSVLAENFNPIDFMYVCFYSALATVFVHLREISEFFKTLSTLKV